MHYQQVAIAIAQSYADLFSDALMMHGALSTAIEDAHAGTEKEQALFGEPNMPNNPIWKNSIIIALFDPQTNIDLIVKTAADECKLPTPQYTQENIPEQDWVRLTQSQFDPIHISSRLRITPSWHTSPEDKNVINLELDPGLAFGTGSHPTTHLCLQWMDEHLQQGCSVLDYGCGSGILTIAALKLGAAQACGVDIDEQAIRASNDNAQQNHVSAQFYLPDDLAEGQFDLVIANILANPLRLLGEMLANRVKTGGEIVLSGILSEQIEEISELYVNWFDLYPTTILEGWGCISGKKRA